MLDVRTCLPSNPIMLSSEISVVSNTSAALYSCIIKSSTAIVTARSINNANMKTPFLIRALMECCGRDVPVGFECEILVYVNI